MSPKMSKSATSETKSKTKTLLLMLEKVSSSTNPDREQTRFLCHKLFQLVNNHEAAKKEISSKSALETVISILETCGDQQTSLTLVNILGEVATGNGMKRLVNHDVTRVLLHTVAYLGKEADSRLLSALLGLSVKIAPKDRRFALRVRLAGALPILVSIVRSCHSHTSSNKLLTTTLQCLKICASNSVNASILGRLGAIQSLHKLIVNIGRKQPSITKTALSTLSLLVRSSRSNSNHAIGNGVITHILSIHQEWHKNDLKNHKHIPARKSMLNILKHLTNSKRGKTAFIDSGGMKILHRTCKECTSLPCPKAAEPLLSVATLILRRCQPRYRLPIPTVQCSFQFPLPEIESDNEELGKSENVVMQNENDVDDVIDLSDDEDLEDDEDDELSSDILDLEGDELLRDEDDKKQEDSSKDVPPAIVIPPVSVGIPPKRAASDLKAMYEKFFPELNEFQTEATSAGEDIEQSTGDWKDIEFLQHDIMQKLSQLSTENENGDSNTSFQRHLHNATRTHSDGNVLPVYDAQASSIYMPPSSAPNPMLNQGSDAYSSLMAALAKSTQSQKQYLNTISYADYFGHVPPPFPEHQVLKRYGAQRVKMLDDIARTLKQGDIVNKVLYTRDGNYKPPKTNEYWSYDVASCNNDDILREVNNVEEKMLSATMCNVNMGVDGPVIEDACRFDTEDQNFVESRFPSISCGHHEPSLFPVLDEERPVRPKTPLNFRSDFECGNLRTAIQVREYEYDLILDADCNTNHHHQWFYFEVSNVVAGVSYRFNIVNCEKSSSQFNSGMQPLMYSVAEARLGSPCWRRVGTNICYYKSHFSRSSASAGGVKGRSYFTLAFTLNFAHSKDICYLAYHYPYTYTQLQADLHKLVNGVDEREMFVRVHSLCETLGQNPVPVLTITAPLEIDPEGDAEVAITEFRSRPYIFLSSRVHPGESNSSWTMRGTLKLLLSTRSSADISQKMLDVAEQLRKSYIFKIVPMLNPDGVINGHHRCSLTGEDLNRQWTDPNIKLFPTIYHTKGLLQYLHSIGKAPLVYCDYHGHSRRKNVFVYGCSRRESVIAGETEVIRGAPDDTGYKALPKLLNKMAPAFSMSNCNFVVEKCKESTARVVVWKEMAVARSYTMESTYCGCDQGKYKGCQIGTSELEEMGMVLCESLLHLKNKDRARRLPLHDIMLSEEENVYNSMSDMSSSDLLSFESRAKLASTSGSDRAVPCPTNSDEELTPDDADSLGSYEAGTGQPSTAFLNDEILIGQYKREFWDYNEYSRGFGFDSEENDCDVTPRADDENMTSSLPSINNGLHHQHGDFVLRSPYQICPDTGRVLYNNENAVDTTLASMLDRNSLYEKPTSSKK